MSPLLPVMHIAPSAFAHGKVPAAAGVDSLEELRRQVARWGETALQDPGAGDIDDVVGWLDQNFFRFRSAPTTSSSSGNRPSRCFE